jgi:hypothetical protein
MAISRDAIVDVLRRFVRDLDDHATKFEGALGIATELLKDLTDASHGLVRST